MDKSCGPCMRCGKDTRESEVAERHVGHEEFNCKNCDSHEVEALRKVLSGAYRFPHNVNLYDLLRVVYGRDSDTNIGYLREKEQLIDRRGFTWWYCDLDLTNQEKVIVAMLNRYPELGGLLS